MRRHSRLTLATFLSLAPMLPAAADAAPAAYVLRPAAIFTPQDGKSHPGGAALVEGERILAVGRFGKAGVQAGAETVSLPGMTLLPGFMDQHSRLSLHRYNETPWNAPSPSAPARTRRRCRAIPLPTSARSSTSAS